MITDFVIYSKENKVKPMTIVARWVFTICHNIFVLIPNKTPYHYITRYWLIQKYNVDP